MAQAMLTAAVSKALFEVQLETLENFKKYLTDKDDVDMEFMEELIGGFKEKLMADYKPEKGAKGTKVTKGTKKGAKADSDGAVEKPKKKSSYTMYIQYQMAQLKKSNPDIKSGKELMSKAVAAWGELTDDVKAQLKATLKEEPELTSEELVTKVISDIAHVSAPNDDKESSAKPSDKEETDKESDNEKADVSDDDEKPKPKPKAKKTKKGQ